MPIADVAANCSLNLCAGGVDRSRPASADSVTTSTGDWPQHKQAAGGKRYAKVHGRMLSACPDQVIKGRTKDTDHSRVHNCHAAQDSLSLLQDLPERQCAKD
jgi:hypothetical protein